MSSPFVAEIRIFAGNFAPWGWAKCSGQIIPIAQNTALFSLLGTFYGGDGKSNFALPNLLEAAPMHQGQGPGLSPRYVGEQGGSSTVTLLQSEIPSHTHTVQGSATSPTQQASPVGAVFGKNPLRGNPWYSTAAPNVTMSPAALSTAGASLPHNNMPPYLGMTFIIALQGVYPARW